MSILLNGKNLANSIAEQLKEQIAQSDLNLTLGIVQVGAHPSSAVYIQHKVKMAARLGVKVIHKQIRHNITQGELMAQLKQWNQDAGITGYIVQLPLPSHLNSEEVIEAIEPRKDVDGLTIRSKGALATHQPGVLPATTRGILSLLDHYNIDIAGQHAVILGRSNLVGLPTALALLHRDASVSILHSKSTNIKHVLSLADIVVVAIGKPRYLDSELLPPKAIVIDVGITSVEGKIYGDANFEQIEGKVEAITPVPGGVGPLTVISLFQNLVDLAREQAT